jgi:alkyl hydroperoxide reductase subunit AhpC
LYSWNLHLLILFSAPVCTTELGEVAKLAEEFINRNCKVIGLSTDSIEDHMKWIADIEETCSSGRPVAYPLIADTDLIVSKLYGMLDPDLKSKTGIPLTVRTVFMIDPSKRIRLMVMYPAAVGRNFSEILRVLDALQTVTRLPVATPVNWQPGGEVIIRPEVNDEQAQKQFSSIRTVKPYLRYTDI